MTTLFWRLHDGDRSLHPLRNSTQNQSKNKFWNGLTNWFEFTWISLWKTVRSTAIFKPQLLKYCMVCLYLLSTVHLVHFRTWKHFRTPIVRWKIYFVIFIFRIKKYKSRMSHFRQLKLLCGVTTIHVNVHSGNFFNRSLSTIILPVLLPGKTILFEPFRSEPFICYGCY